MLVLSRKTNEKILIGHNIEVQILGYCGHQVRIGITAPTDVTIHREEVFNRKKTNQDKESTHEQFTL